MAKMIEKSGNILKMKSELTRGGGVEYSLPIGDQYLALNPYLGHKVLFEFSGQINCIATGEKIKKSYNQGYSYRAFQTLARCDLCIVKPHLCHFDQGTCREPQWGKEHCFIDHYVYLSVSSHLKVGITRHTQLPTRWIDQGASCALPVARVSDRKTAGLIEVEIAKNYSDRTNWRAMLKGEYPEVDLEFEREKIFEDFGDLLDDFNAEDVDDPITEISYPAVATDISFPIKSLSFDKNPRIEGTLLGIKGQYLILDVGVLNMRKHQGYHLNIQFI